jgi:hypothetical protein
MASEEGPKKIDQETRSELSFEWIAKYEDGTELHQYDDKNDLEYHFGHVDQGRLSEFVLVSRADPSKTFSVNLKTGLFSRNGTVLEKVTVDGKEISLGLRISEGTKIYSSLGNRLKLIYYRRTQRDSHVTVDNMGQLVAITGNLRQMYHFIGWEGTVNDKFYKFEAALTHQGELYIPPPQETFIPLIEA